MGTKQATVLTGRIDYKGVSGEQGKDLSGNAVVRVYGMAVKAKTVQSIYGDGLAFHGRFRAINLVTGEVTNSARMFLPGIAENMLASALADSPGGVTFAYDLGRKKSDKVSVGYEYTVAVLADADASDPIIALEASLPAPTKMLSEGKPDKKKK